jgi:hypothetical protein
MALWGDSPRFEHPEDAKQAVQKLIQEREDLKRSTTALEDLIGNQKQVLEELEMQVDAAQRRAADAVQQAKSKMEELQAQDAELAAAKSRFNMALHVFSLEKDFLKLSQRVGRARQSLFPPPLVISGPSAVGKASLISRLFQDFPDSFSIPISHTSREPQEAEQNGVHFIFISREYMEKAMAGGSFVEVAEVDGDLYGTSIQAVSKVQGEGKVCVLHIDLAGVEQLRQSSLQPVNTLSSCLCACMHTCMCTFARFCDETVFSHGRTHTHMRTHARTHPPTRPHLHAAGDHLDRTTVIGCTERAIDRSRDHRRVRGRRSSRAGA